MKKGLIFDIKRFAVHDGPGIRTTIFLKGCPLKCPWCQNPEGIKTKPELIFYKNKCISCDSCKNVCKAVLNNEVCDSCESFECTEVCPTNARQVVGEYMSLEQVMNEIKKDMILYQNSQGGITLSGGEPLLQSEFVLSLLKECKKQGIHTVIETCGYVKFEDLNSIQDYVDLIIYDLKIFDEHNHKKIIGVSNNLILENLKKISKNVLVRIPIIPSYTDNPQNINNLLKFVASIGVKKVEFVSYNKLWLSKAKALNLNKIKFSKINPPSNEKMEELKKIAKYYDLIVESN